MLNGYLAQEKIQDLHRAAEKERLARSVHHDKPESGPPEPRHTRVWRIRKRTAVA